MGSASSKGAHSCDDCRKVPGHVNNTEHIRCVACEAGQYAKADLPSPLTLNKYDYKVGSPIDNVCFDVKACSA